QAPAIVLFNGDCAHRNPSQGATKATNRPGGAPRFRARRGRPGSRPLTRTEDRRDPPHHTQDGTPHRLRSHRAFGIAPPDAVSIRPPPRPWHAAGCPRSPAVESIG